MKSTTTADVVYLTTPIYYVNDSPHIGHAYTTIAADVLARYHRLRGRDVFLLTGTDEHGAKVAASAAKAGKTPKAFADEVSGLFRSAFEELNIQFDEFIRTTDDEHVRQVLIFMEKLKASGALYEGEYEGMYCTGCEEFKTEKELVDGKCPIHLKPVEHVKERNWFFRLKQYLPKVKQLIESGALEIVPRTRKEEVLGLFKQGLADFSVSRSSVEWGIPFPGEAKQTIYVWVEALQNYITALGYADDRPAFEKFWPHVTHFIGKDILKFHAVYWPAMLIAAGEEPPKRIIVNGYLQLDGQKMSKSLGNVIAPHELIQKFGVDATRYLLMAQFPFGEDGNIQAEKFTEKYNADLANGIGNLASRVLTMIQKFCGGEMPVYDLQELHEEYNDTGRRQSAQIYENAIKEFRFDGALKTAMNLVQSCDYFISGEEPWLLAKKNPERLKKVLASLILSLQQIGYEIEPFMPNIAKNLGVALCVEKFTSYEEVEDPIPPGRVFQPLEPLFPRLEGGDWDKH